MKAIRDTQGFSVLTIPGENGDPVRIPNSPRFLDICGGVGWPDLVKQDSYSLTWFVVVGQAEDGAYQVIAEHGGAEGEVAKAMIDWKDICLIEHIYLEETEDQREMVQFLRDPDYYDGLTAYDRTDINEFNNLPIYRHTGQYWKHFRSYDHTAALIPVRDRLQANLLAGWEKIVELNRRGRLIVLEECPKTVWILGLTPPWREILEHPLAKALINCIGMMELTRPQEEREMRRPGPVYENWR